MNIFYTDENPVHAAWSLPDKHISKMPVECVQLLVSALNRSGIEHDIRTKAGDRHRGGYPNHPCTVWTAASRLHFEWVLAHGYALCVEFERRFGRVHACLRQLQAIDIAGHADELKEDTFSAPPQCMPDDLKVGDTVTAYRRCIAGKVLDKPGSFYWRRGDAPSWLASHLETLRDERFAASASV